MCYLYEDQEILEAAIKKLRCRRVPSRKKKELRKRAKKERVYRIKSNNTSRRDK